MQTLHRSLSDLTRLARLAQRLGDVRTRGPYPTTSEIADSIGEEFHTAALLIDRIEKWGWVASVPGRPGVRCWKPTESLPPVAETEQQDTAVIGQLMSAAITFNVRGVGL